MKLHSEISGGWLTIYLAVLVSVTGNNMIADDREMLQANNAGTPGSLLGRWKLNELYYDRGDGTGNWHPAMQPDTISFYADGKFNARGESPFTARKFNQYKLTGDKISFTCVESNYTEVYPYVLESPGRLMMSPICREKCMRRYLLIDKTISSNRGKEN